MKKRYLKKWVVNTLIIINLIALLILGSESKNNFIMIHMIPLLIFIINCLILKKYSKLGMEI